MLNDEGSVRRSIKVQRCWASVGRAVMTFTELDKKSADGQAHYLSHCLTRMWNEPKQKSFVNLAEIKRLETPSSLTSRFSDESARAIY